jgi:hypothetical protein
MTTEAVGLVHCGLCGEMIPEAWIDSILHACCGCGWRDASLDGQLITTQCPNCN